MALCNGALVAPVPAALNAQTNQLSETYSLKNKSSQSITANTKLIKSNGMQRIPYTRICTSKESSDKPEGRNKVENSDLLAYDAVLLDEYFRQRHIPKTRMLTNTAVSTSNLAGNKVVNSCNNKRNRPYGL